ncbi:MAG TPA: hypothetical protein VM757_02765 [Sphingomicrobium sp.]|nr:hypothetical protein [Sphingomicrobium sp.]
MVARIRKAEVLAQADIVAAPARACTDRSFELPPAIHIATALMFIGFVSVLSFAFRNPEMAVPWGVFVAFIAAFFIVPGLWTRMKPEESRTPALTWTRFAEQGIDTATGRTSATEATVLVLLLPFLILCWAIAIAAIAALI